MHVPSEADRPDAGCEAFLAALDVIVDGEVDALAVARHEAHARGCMACARRLAAARRYRERMRRVGEAERMPDEVRARVMHLLSGARGSRTR